MKEKIKQEILVYGADVCGVANIERFADAPEGFSPKDIYGECKSVIVFGKSLSKGLMKVDSRLIYGHFNSFICSEVDRIALEGARFIEKCFDAMAIPLPCDAPYEYWEQETMTGKGLISMRHAAVQSGLGQLGKNGLLLNPQYGNLLIIGAILTDMDLESDEFCADICIAGCRKCMDSCPVQAIADGMVNQSLCRPNAFGKNARGFGTVDCNRCRVVCPRKFGCGE